MWVKLIYLGKNVWLKGKAKQILANNLQVASHHGFL
jgi:hypothetical protein